MESSDSAAIDSGTISGTLPESDDFAVHFPGYPSSPSRAIETLGGKAAIAKVRSSEDRKLELRFRPDDPYCHPVFGELRHSASLLLKIKKSAEGLTGEVVARVTNTYSFEGMADYQHVIPVHAAKARQKKRPWAVTDENGKEGPSAKCSVLDMDQDDVMMLVPPLFSIKDTPEKLVLKPTPNLFSKSIQTGVVVHSWETEIEPCLAVASDIDRVPVKVNWEDHIPKDSVEWTWQVSVAKLFEERPIWIRRSLHDRLLGEGHQVSENQIKRLLFRTGYYFSTGPFGKFWIKKGYDPRKDPESRIYQRVDFRMPPQLRYLTSASDAESKQSWKDICQFKVWPWKIFISLQLLELDDEFIQEEIRKPVEQATFTHATGWFSRTLFRSLKLRVSMRFLSRCENRDAEHLLRSTRELFERSRRSGPLDRSQKSRKDIQVAKDSNDPVEVLFLEPNVHEHADLERPDNSDIEEEEEFDGYDPEIACEDGMFATGDTSYNTGESIPNDYLQAILRGFPFNKAAGDQEGFDLPGGNFDEDEYQIYEQDSDGNDDYF